MRESGTLARPAKSEAGRVTRLDSLKKKTKTKPKTKTKKHRRRARVVDAVGNLLWKCALPTATSGGASPSVELSSYRACAEVGRRVARERGRGGVGDVERETIERDKNLDAHAPLVASRGGFVSASGAARVTTQRVRRRAAARDGRCATRAVTRAGATANAPSARVDDITKRVGASARETAAKYQHASRVA